MGNVCMCTFCKRDLVCSDFQHDRCLITKECSCFDIQDDVDVLISINELLNKLVDKDAYEKMTVYSVRELIESCNKIFYKDPEGLFTQK